MNHLKFNALFKEPDSSPIYPYLSLYTYPWDIIPHLGKIILKLCDEMPPEEYYSPAEDVLISRSARVHPSANIEGPCIIMEGAELRPGAYIRGNALIGREAVVGNCSEVKNAVLFDKAQIPHFNYIGDSILGYRAHLGAGAVASNLKSDKTPVTVLNFGQKTPTGLRKLGAIIGDRAEIGCGAVLNPGTVVGRCATVYPLSSVRGYVEENSIYKSPRLTVRRS